MDEAKSKKTAMASWIAPLAGIVMLILGSHMIDEADQDRLQLTVILCGVFLQPLGLGLAISCLSFSQRIESTAFRIHAFIGAIVSLTTTATLIVHIVFQSVIPTPIIWDAF